MNKADIKTEGGADYPVKLLLTRRIPVGEQHGGREGRIVQARFVGAGLRPRERRDSVCWFFLGDQGEEVGVLGSEGEEIEGE